MALDGIHEMTLRIYDTVADASIWPEVLDRFVSTVGAQGSIIFEWEGGEADRRLCAPLYSGFYNADALRVYLEKYAHLEANDQTVVRRNTGGGDEIEIIDDTILANSVDELLEQEHAQKIQRFGIMRRAAGVMNKDNRWLSLFSVQFEYKEEPLTDDEREMMTALLPHFAKALDLGLPTRQLMDHHQGMLAAMDRLRIGLCILDARGRIVVRNQEFMRQQDAYSAFRTTQEGALQIVDDQGQKALDALMQDARFHGRYGARPRKEAIPTSVDECLCIEISPLNRADEIGTRTFDGFVLCSTDTSQPVECDARPMKSAYGLTNAELSLVEAIGEGLTNREIAERRERSVATINSQVKTILAKSQCANRTQFVRAMMRFGARFLKSA